MTEPTESTIEEVGVLIWNKAPIETVDLLAIKKLSEAFDAFVDACLDENGKPKAPDRKAILKAKACLPPYCKHSFKRK